jgi:hypothetical protein
MAQHALQGSNREFCERFRGETEKEEVVLFLIGISQVE